MSDESNPLLPGESVQWRNILREEVADTEMQDRIRIIFDQSWATGLHDLPYYSDRMFERMWG